MKRKMTRRNFLKVAAAVSAAGVMSACGGDGMPPASSGNGNTGNTGNAGDTGNSGETPDNGSGGDSGEEEEVIETNWKYRETDYLVPNGTVEITGYNGTLEPNVVIPEKIGKYTVTIIGGLDNRDEILSVTIPANVKKISNSAFSECHSLKQIYFSEGLEAIWDDAFYKCTSLQSIDLPSSVNHLGQRIFNGCEKIKTVSIPSNVHGLYGTFQGSGITEIVIPDTVEEITSETFLGCKDLVKVELQGNHKWGDNEFAQCSSLELIELPDDMEKSTRECFAIAMH